MISSLRKLAEWIKSPQLYQLSYQPKFSKRLSKLLAEVSFLCADVPAVYPTRSSVSSEDEDDILGAAYSRWVGP